MPAKIVAKMTETKVKNAENVAIVASALKVRGSEQAHDTMATIALNAIVQIPWLDMVLRYLAPVKQWKPMMNVLFSRNMTAVKYHAQRLPQNSIWPMSQTSLTSGWRIQNSLQILVSCSTVLNSEKLTKWSKMYKAPNQQRRMSR